jgi:hypothetical protein
MPEGLVALHFLHWWKVVDVHMRRIAAASTDGKTQEDIDHDAGRS